MSSFVNISAYRFAPLDELPAWRERLLEVSRANDLRGTILLSQEGINLFVAGTRAGIDALLAVVRVIPGLAELAPKESFSREQPFGRMRVKIKKEIITFGVPDVDPARHPSARVAPKTLKQWLDEGRRVTLLDTRNDYEVRLGTFRGAVVPGIDHFRAFPAAVGKLPAHLKDELVVTFCTGGIRCEKAAPYLERVGFKNVYQLDGGILRYFEECAGAHFEGDCFVFDERVAVDLALREANTVLCVQCQRPLTEAEQRDPCYVPDARCPRCAAP